MRTAFALLCFFVSLSLHAREWKSELFHCTANLPDTPGWQTIQPPATAGLTSLVVIQHLGRQAVLGISVVDKVTGADLAQPAVQKTLEEMLRQFGYQFIGHSTAKVGGLDWLQYPVRTGPGAQQVSGVVRFASAGGYVFSITMLKGGGQDAARDEELQQTAASFRALPTIASEAPTGRPVSETTAAAKGREVNNTTPDTTESASDSNPNLRLAWYAGGGVVVLLIFFSIIGSGRTGKR